MAKLIKTLFLSAAVIAAPAMATQRDTPEAQLQKMLAGRVAGPAVDCISLPRINSSQIIAGKAIVYRSGNTLYVNEPRSGASSLDDDAILVTRTFNTQLCSIDTVQLIDRSSHFPRGSVFLGKFVPYSKPKPAN